MPEPDFSDASQYGLSVSTQEPAGRVPALDASDAAKFGLTVSAKEPNAQAADFSDAGKFGLTLSSDASELPDQRFARVPGDAVIRNQGAIPSSPLPVAGGMNVTGVAPYVPDAINPAKGAQLAVQGVEQMAEPGAAEKLRGAGKVAIGGVQAAGPLLLPLGAAAPLESLAWIGIGEGTGATAGELARRNGASPEDANEIDQAASLLPMAFGVARSGLRAIAENRAATREAIAQHFENQAATRPGAQNVEVTVANPETGKLESTPVAMGGQDRIPVQLKSPNGPRDAFIEYHGEDNAGTPYFRIVDAKNGKIIQAGEPGSIATVLQRDAVDASWLQRLRQASGVSDLGNEAPTIPMEAAAKTELVREQQILGTKENGGSLDTSDAGQYGVKVSPEEPSAVGDQQQAEGGKTEPAAPQEVTNKATTEEPTAPAEQLSVEPSVAETPEAAAHKQLATLQLQGDELRTALANPDARSHVVGTAVSWWLGGQNAQHNAVPLMKQLLQETLPGGALEELHPGSVMVYRGHRDGQEIAKDGVSSFSVSPEVAQAYAQAKGSPESVRSFEVTPETPAIALDKLHQVVRPDFDFNAMQKAGLAADHEVIAMENHRGEVVVDENYRKSAAPEAQPEAEEQTEEEHPADEAELEALEGQHENALESEQHDELRGRGEGGVSRARPAAARQSEGEESSVVVPGEDLSIGTKYAVRELSDVYPSHSGVSFQPNPDYQHHNERDYSKPENQERIIRQSSEERFNPRYLVTDNPDALNGPPVIDEDGNVLGGNSRAMTMQRVYGRNGKAAEAYRELLAKKALQFGIDPRELAHFKQPVLVRLASDEALEALPGASKWAIRKTNVAGTAALSASEQATADAGQLTPEMMAQISASIVEAGPNATLNDALTGPVGTRLVNELIADGFFSEQERPKLMDGKTGALTQDAKNRIAKALLGQFFQDSDQYQRFPASLKQKLERVAAPLATVAEDPDWNLLPEVREAVNLIEYAEAHGIKNLSDVVAQRDMFGSAEKSPWSPKAITLAELLKNGKPNEVVAAFRHYVASKEPTMFGELTPADAFRDAFEDEGPAALADIDQGANLWGFYSQLERVIEQKMPAKVSPAQALAILQNPQHGVKADELKWTGLADWLKQQTGTLTRQQIFERASDERVRVSEKALPYGKYSQYSLPGQKSHYTELLFTWNPPSPETPEYRAYRKIFDQLEAKYGHQRYNPTSQFPSGWPWFADGASYYGSDPLTPEERKAYNQAVDAWDRESDYQNQYGPRYDSPHWDSTKNVLAHTRFDERRDAQGRRVLFLEEIQSDWHQEGRKKGYDEASRTQLGRNPNIPPDAPFRSTWHELVFRRMVRFAADHGYDALAWTTGKQQAARYDLAKHVSGIAFRPTEDEYILQRWAKDHPNERPAEDNPLGALYFRRLPRRGEDADLLEWEWARSGNNHLRASDLAEHIGKEAAKKLLAQPLSHVPNTESRQQHQLMGEDLAIGGHGMSGFYDSILPAYAAKFGKKWGVQPELTKVDTTERSSPSLHYEGPEYSIEKVEQALARARAMAPTFDSPFTGQRQVFVFNRVDNQAALEVLHGNLLAGMPFREAVDETGSVGVLAPILGGKVTQRETPQTPKTETVHSLAVTPAMRESVVQGQPLFAKPLQGEAYDPAHSYTPSEIVGAADWELLPESNRRALRMRVNWQAGQTLADVMRMGSFSGATASADSLPTYARRIAQNAIDWLERGAITPAAATRLNELAAALLDMHRDAQGRPVFFQRDRIAEAPAEPGARMRTLREQAATEREEQTHIQQAAYTRLLDGRGGEHHLTPQALRSVTAGDAWPAIQAALAAHDLFYARQPLAVQVAEAGAKLLAGRFDQIRVSVATADRWLRGYYRALKASHGEEAAHQVFRFADKRFKLIPDEETHGQSGPRGQSDSLHPRPGDSQQSLERGAGERPEKEGNGGTLPDTGRPGEERSLFGRAENDEVARTAAEDRDRLQGERLTAQFKAPLSRDEQLKKLKRSKENPQSDLFGENEEPPQGALFDRDRDKDVTLGSGLGALQPYVEKFLKNDVVPTAKQAGELAKLAADDIKKVLAPASRGEAAKTAALSVRKNAAELQRSTDRAEAALRVAKKYFDAQKPEANFDFIDRMEAGEKQAAADLNQFAGLMRELLDARREAIRSLGKGKLEKFIENYFPHIWKKPALAADFYANWAKRPLEGSKAFLKKRSIDSFAAGLEHGLEPVSTNPVELVLQKAREMDKYLTAQHIFDDLKEAGLLQFVDAREGKAPQGWVKIDDPSATVYGPSVQNITEYPNEGLWQGLEKVADALGVKQERGFLDLRGAIGRAGRDGSVRTLHGTAEDVLAHEIGHQIDFRAGSGKKFIEEYPDAETVRRLKRARKALKDTKLSTPEERKFAREELKDLAPAIQKRKVFAKELRDLADLRSGEPGCTHKREEKMAQLAEMWVGARELFQRTAPTVFRVWKQFLDANPKLHALRDIEGNTEVTAISQPYDVGGLVIKGHWWAPEQAATIVNHYLSPGLRDKSAAFRAFLGLGNILNQAQLGFSAFHLAFTSVDVATSKLALGFYQAGHGDFLKGLKSAALTPLAPFTNIARGDKLLKEWYAPGTQGARVGELVDAMVQAGGRAKMDSFYQTRVSKRMLEAWRAGNVFGALLRLPGTLIESSAKPILDYLVPRQKLGVFADMARYELERLGPDADPLTVQAALARAWDSVDNRLGELVYDNLFWHKVTKDLAMVSVRSVGWNVGTIREVGGGAADLVKLATGKGNGSGLRRNKDGSFGPDFDRELTPRMAYVPALAIVAGLLGALLYYLWHGHAPKHLKDYFFPTDAHGRRWSLPTYMKDLYEYGTNPVRTVEGKIHPLLAAVWEMLNNKDFYDKPIMNPHHRLVKRAEEEAEFLAKQFLPLSYQAAKPHHKASAQQQLLGLVGVRPAPKSLDKHAH